MNIIVKWHQLSNWNYALNTISIEHIACVTLLTGSQPQAQQLMISVCVFHVPGVLPVGGDSLAAAVSQSFPVVLLLHSADATQDAAGRLPAAGREMLS